MRLKITDAGFAKLVNTSNTGTNAVLVTQVGLTSTAFTPLPELTTLPGEIKRLATFGGQAVGDDTVHVTIRDDTVSAYSLRGFGLYLADGTLFATYGQADPIMEKTSESMLLLATDTRFSEIDATQIQFGNAEFIYPPATTEVRGVVELATSSEAEEGADSERAITPRGLRAFIDKRFGASAPSTLVRTLLSIATDAAFRSALGLKSAALKDEGADKGLDADLLDGRHGTHYLDWRNMTGVPSSVHVPGQVIMFAGSAAPNGMLLCNGAAVPRATYPALFAAIGTRYGSGDGTTSFNLPLIREGTVVVQTTEPQSVGTFTTGAVIAHAHTGSTENAGLHGHALTIGNAGGHAHGASASAVGDHAHGAWTDAQGSHNHGVNDPGHSHTWNGPASGGSGGWAAATGARPNPTGTSHNGTGIWLNDAGGHGHNIGMNGAGAHTHSISVAAVGDHSHPASVSNGGEHSHAVNVRPTGGDTNLPAGLRMIYCIAY
ncbi:tail fiber protein [Stenotrophomonas pavanii]|uniref:tail fiber protein n=1 Tax=Stenotrophomonas pavanii TaxID=487698 RepID=UPI0013124FD2